MTASQPIQGTQPSASADKQKLQGVANLLLLQQRLRQARTIAQLASFVVNDSRLLFAYRTSFLWFGGKLTGVSGLPQPVSTAPFSLWVKDLCRRLEKDADKQVRLLSPHDFDGEIAQHWNEYFPDFAIWVPLFSPDEEQIGGLFLVRDTAWKEEEQRLIAHWGETVSYSLYALSLKPFRPFAKLTKGMRLGIVGIITAVVVALLFVQVNLSVLAPAEVVPKEPEVVRAQLDGVVGDVLVRPNQLVKAGDVLLRLDDTALNARLDVVVQELEIAKAEKLRAEQASVSSQEASRQVPLLTAQIVKKQAEVDYVRSLLSRIEVRAKKAGVAVIPDASELEGLPVKIGQRLLVLAEPDQAELEAWVPIGDSLKLPVGAPVELYLNIDPTQPRAAQLQSADYQAQVSPEGVLAFRMRARFEGHEPPRIGWRGTAKIYGEPVTLGYYLFRRPMAFARQWLGL